MLSQELEAITNAKNEEIAKINAETERLNATVAQKEMDLANIGSVIGAIVVVLVLFVLFINLNRKPTVRWASSLSFRGVSDYLSNSLPPVDFKYIDLMYGILKSTALSSIAVLSIILRHIRLTRRLL